MLGFGDILSNTFWSLKPTNFHGFHEIMDFKRFYILTEIQP